MVMISKHLTQGLMTTEQNTYRNLIIIYSQF